MGVKTIDEYLSGVAPAQRGALERLRGQIRAAAPDAEECLSYGQPAFRVGRVICGFGASKKHCAFYLFNDTTLERFSGELSDRDVGKGTVRFQPDRPLPADLVERLVKARVAECAALDDAKRKRYRPRPE